MSLHNKFIDSKNVNIILDTVISIIVDNNGPLINKNNKVFFDTFNKIASSVYQHEHNKLENNNNSLFILNDIVIKELSKYILSKKDSFTVFRDSTISNISPVSNVSTVILPKKDHGNTVETLESKFRFNLVDYNKTFTPVINNVSNIKLNNLHMYNKEYLINNSNNKLFFKEKLDPKKELYSDIHEIIIDPGNYNEIQLLEALEYSMNTISYHKIYKCYLHKITNKLVIMSVQTVQSIETDKKIIDFDINILLQLNEFSGTYSIDKTKSFEIINKDSNISTILSILGFSKESPLLNTYNNIFTPEFPIKLIKKNIIDFTFLINKNVVINESIILNNSNDSTIYPLNIQLDKLHKLQEYIDIESISIDFHDYNHNDYPFILSLDIYQKSI